MQHNIVPIGRTSTCVRAVSVSNSENVYIAIKSSYASSPFDHIVQEGHGTVERTWMRFSASSDGPLNALYISWYKKVRLEFVVTVDGLEFADFN